MLSLYNHKLYKQQLKFRNHTQTIMLGFSDGTKDGGYVTANWAIFKAKFALTQLAEQYGIKTIFFDGRGGPPARGGGNTHLFYRAMQNHLKQKEIQLTIQGQTVSSSYGTPIAASFNMEQLFTAGLEANLFPKEGDQLTEANLIILEQLSDYSFSAYQQLKEHPLFIRYLEQITPLNYYGELNIASRPPKRSKSKQFEFSDLRAIPFVGAWSQMKQNVPGYYGLGTALKKLIDEGRLQDLRNLYKHSLFFRTLLENAMQSLLKSYFPLTHYLKLDAEFGKFWQLLYKEAQLTQRMLIEVSEQTDLLGNHPEEKNSIQIREETVLPLLVIQQYALMMLRENPGSPHSAVFHKLVVKSLAANINASRNAV